MLVPEGVHSRQRSNWYRCPKAGKGLEQFQGQKWDGMVGIKDVEDQKTSTKERASTFTLNECPFANINFP